MKNIRVILLVFLLITSLFVLSSCEFVRNVSERNNEDDKELEVNDGEEKELENNDGEIIEVDNESWNAFINSTESSNNDREYWHIFLMYYDFIGYNGDMERYERYSFDKSLYNIYKKIDGDSKYIGLYVDERVDDILINNGKYPLLIYNYAGGLGGKIGVSIEVLNDLTKEITQLNDVDKSFHSFEFDKDGMPRFINGLALAEVIKLHPYEMENIETGEKSIVYGCWTPNIFNMMRASFDEENWYEKYFVKKDKDYLYFEDSGENIPNEFVMCNKNTYFDILDEHRFDIDCNENVRRVKLDINVRFVPDEDKKMLDEFFEFLSPFIIEKDNEGSTKEKWIIDFDMFIEGLREINK